MLTATSLYVDRLVGRQLLNTTGGTNHDVYDQRLTAATPWAPFNHEPRCIYFYYIVVEDSGKLRVDHEFYNMGPDFADPVKWAPIPHAKVPDLMTALAIKARTGGLAVKGDNFQHIKWTHRSYIAFVADEANWTLHTRSSGNAAVVFNVDKPGVANRSFFDARNVSVTLPADRGRTEERSAFYFVDHMTKDSQGTQLDTSEVFYFDMYFAVDFVDPLAIPMTVILDPTGTNQGPPELPDP